MTGILQICKMGSTMNTIHLGTENLDPDAVIRKAWGEALQEFMDSAMNPETGKPGMTRKQLKARIEEVSGIDVSLQTIALWLAGKTAPRPSMQIVIGKAFNVPARFVFKLEAVA